MRIRNGNQILLLSIVAALAFWLADSGMDYFLHSEAPFLEILIYDHSELSFRLLACAGFLIFGYFLSRTFERQRKTEERLQSEIRERRWADPWCGAGLRPVAILWGCLLEGGPALTPATFCQLWQCAG